MKTKEDLFVNVDGMTSVQRMDKFLTYLKGVDYKLTDNKVAIMSGLSAGIFTNMRKRNAVAYTTIIAIGKTFPELNVNWVIYGEGEMLLKRHEEVGNEQTVIEFLKDWISKLQKENGQLHLEIDNLQKICSEKMLTTQQIDLQ